MPSSPTIDQDAALLDQSHVGAALLKSFNGPADLYMDPLFIDRGDLASAVRASRAFWTRSLD